MFEIQFYKDKNGKSEIIDYLDDCLSMIWVRITHPFFHQAKKVKPQRQNLGLAATQSPQGYCQHATELPSLAVRLSC